MYRSCEIYDARKVDAEHAETKFAVSLIAKSNGDIAAVLSVTLNGEAVGYEQKSMYVNNTDYLQLTLKTGAVYLVDIAEGSVVLLEEVTVTTEDGAYRFTLRVAGDLIIECIKFEKLTSSDFEEKNFDWAGNANGEEGGKPYNYEVDTDGYATVYYFEIVKQDGTWTAELVKIQEW